MTDTVSIQSAEGPQEAEILYRSGGVVVHAVLRKSGFGAGFTVTNAATGLRYLAGKQIFKSLEAAKSLADWIAARPVFAELKSQADAEAVPREQVSALRGFTDRLLAGENQ
jgi:hypothetical protein